MCSTVCTLLHMKCQCQVFTHSLYFCPGRHLFFTSPVPEQAPAMVDVTTLCPVPDIPAAMVTAVNGTGFSYCTVSTSRGSFRSRSIITEEGYLLHDYVKF